MIVIGGGVVGACVAMHLAAKKAGRVVLLERDTTFVRASTWRAMGGIRQQFTSAVDVALVQASLPMHLRAGMVQRGYLFLATEANEARLARRFEAMRVAGAHVVRVTVGEIRARVPDAALDDVRFGVFGPDDGYADPRAILAHARSCARSAGAELVTGEAVAIDTTGGRVRGVRLLTGERIEAPCVVNAGGAFAAKVGALAGLDVPVAPVRQHAFRARLPRAWPYAFPMLVDPTGVHFRHETPEVVRVAWASRDEPPGENLTCDDARWARDFLPPLVRRMPVFRDLVLLEGWAGHYEVTPDHHPILGAHPELPGFVLANGFSGHGLMMAPAVGLALAELVTDGRFVTFDLARYSIARFARGEPLHDPEPVI